MSDNNLNASILFLLYIIPLDLKLRVLPRGILSPSYKTGVDSRLCIIPFRNRLSDMPKNYKSHYNSRLDSIFGSKLPIRSSSKFVFDCGFTESLFVTTLFRSPMQKVNSIQTIRDYIISMVIIFSKWILDIYYISPLDSYLVLFFCCIALYFIITFLA